MSCEDSDGFLSNYVGYGRKGALTQVSVSKQSYFCNRSGRTIHLENELMDVNVIPVPEPVVHISGTSDISREYEDFKLGTWFMSTLYLFTFEKRMSADCLHF